MKKFNECLQHSGLDDIKSMGCKYTWTNKQKSKDRVWGKLDRVMVNTTWLANFPNSQANFLTAGIFDHSPVVVTIFLDTQHISRFSFLNSCATHPKFMDIVTEAWQTQVAGSHAYIFFEKLKLVKKIVDST